VDQVTSVFVSDAELAGNAKLGGGTERTGCCGTVAVAQRAGVHGSGGAEGGWSVRTVECPDQYFCKLYFLLSCSIFSFVDMQECKEELSVEIDEPNGHEIASTFEVNLPSLLMAC
jgi:hypothetical protein